MTPQELKNSILQLAIQGKLVEQRPEEGTGEELYREIQWEKQRLIAAGKIKKEKPLPEIAEEEKPFEIPESWVWVRIEDCLSNRAGLTYKKENLEKKSSNMIRVLRGGNIIDMGLVIKPDDVMISSEFVGDELFLKENMLITPAVTSIEHIGKIGRIERSTNDTVVGGFVIMLVPHYSKETFSKYLLYSMSSKYFRDCCRSIVNKSGQAFYNLSRNKMMKLLLPLPPYEEQKRIIRKIEEILPVIDQYGKAWNRLETFNKRFPEDMKKSILQLAIQGKLVEQRPEEGTAEELYQQIQAEKEQLIKAGKLKKEKPLPEIREEGIPFEIPESWKWVFVGDIFSHNTGKAMNSTAKQTGKKGSIQKFITTSNLYWNRFDLTTLKEMFFSDEELVRCTATKNDILMCEGGAYYGRTAIWNYDFDICFQNHVHRLRAYVPIVEMYFYYVFRFYRETGKMQSKGTAMPGLSSIALHNMVIPLPPLAEQRRIVAKLEELLPLCDKLK